TYVSHAGDISTRPGQTFDEPTLYWVIDTRHDDGNRVRRLLDRQRFQCSWRKDKVNGKADQFCRNRGQLLDSSLRAPVLNPKCFPVALAANSHRRYEGAEILARRAVIRPADPVNLGRLLGRGGERSEDNTQRHGEELTPSQPR